MTDTSDKHEQHLTLTYRVHKGITDMYIGKMVEIPRVIVYSETKEGLKSKIHEALKAYFQAFPEETKFVSDNIESTEKIAVEV